MNPTIRCLMALAILSSAPAQALTRSWPGAAPCAGTLQACIAASASGDRIEIVTNGPIDESISVLDKSLDVVAANGYRPQFANNRNVSITSSSLAGNLTTTVSGLRLRGGYVLATYLGVGTANYTIRNMTLDATSAIGGYISSEVRRGTTGVGTLNLVLDNNRVDCGQNFLGDSAAIGVSAKAGATLNARLLHNRVTCSALGGIVNYGIRARVGSPDVGVATVDLRLHGNEVRVVPFTGTPSGVPVFTGIAVVEDGGSLSPSAISTRLFSNAVIGDGNSQSSNALQFLVDNGDLNAIVINNTFTGFYQSLYAGSYNTPGSGPQVIDGPVRNNLMVSYGPAFYAQATTTSGLTNDHNLVNATGLGGVTLGAGSITAPARLISSINPRLRSDSPAIDAADTASMALGIAFAGLPVLDADGLRRIKGTSGDADIGAYEYGDVSFDHLTTAANTSGNNTLVNSPALNGVATALAFANPNITLGAAGMSQPFGVYYAGSFWRLFDQTSTLMTPNVGFNLFVPATGSGLFEHIATAATTSSYFTLINNAATDDRPDAIVLVTQNWEPNHVYNPHPVGLYYAAPNWFVDNLDRIAMPVNAGFNVYAQPASPNAWRATATAANLASGALRVDHPLLDGKPCARPQGTRLSNGTVASNWTWIYSNDQWYILGYDALPSGTQFHIVVDPAQVAACSDRIFAHGFE